MVPNDVMTKHHDAKNLPQEVHQYNRDLAIRLFHGGKTRKNIAEIIGVNYVPITHCDWIRARRKCGKDALQLQKHGCSS